MATEVVMPKWGLSMQEGLIGQWLKREGDSVQKGEALLEVETEKISNVVEAPESGVLARILFPEGETVPVTHVIALIAAPGEQLADAAPPAPTSNGAAETNGAVAHGSAAAVNVPAPHQAANIPAMPAARKLAKEHGLDLATVQGSGPGGTITRGDVERALAASPAPAAESATAQVGNIPAMPAARKLAKELGLDLRQIQGSGPNGTITRADVERARPAAQPVATLLPLEKVAFFSDGYRLDGLLYNPKDLVPGERRPGVVLCVGYTYLKTMVMPDIAKVLTAAGYVALVFDYRGFGESEGPRGRLIPNEQVADVRAALTFLADLPQVDESRLALVGISLGGSNAIAAAALDRRVSAAVALEPMGDGERWLKSLRRHWEWHAFQQCLAEDRSQRTRSGQSACVDPLEIVVPDPDSRTFLDQVAAAFPQMKVELPLESADALIEYSPERLVGRLGPRPLLIIHGSDDRLVPVEEAYSLAAHAGPAARLEVIPGMGHFDWVTPKTPGFERVAQLTADFLQEEIPV